MIGRIVISLIAAATLSSVASGQARPSAQSAFNALKTKIERIRGQDSMGRHHKYTLVGQPCVNQLTLTRWDHRPRRSESSAMDWKTAGPFTARNDDVDVTTVGESFGLFMGSEENARDIASAMTALAAACR